MNNAMTTRTTRRHATRIAVVLALLGLAGGCSSDLPDVPDKALSVDGQVAATSGLDLITQVQDKAADLLGDKAGDDLHCHVQVDRETINDDPLALKVTPSSDEGDYVMFLCAPVPSLVKKASHPYVQFRAPAGKGSVDVAQMTQGGQNQSIDVTSNLLPWPPEPATS